MPTAKPKKTKQSGVGKPAQFQTKSLRMSADLFDRVKDAAAKTNLTIANTMRLAMERGLEKVVEQLTSQPS